MGSDSKNLICKVVQMLLQQVHDVNGDQIDKLHQTITMLSNNVNHWKAMTLEILEIVFGDIYLRIQLIQVPTTDISELEKVHIKVTAAFFGLLQKSVVEYTAAYLLSARNFPHLRPLIGTLFDYLEKGADFATKKHTCTILRSLQVQLNGLSQNQLSFLYKKPMSSELVQQLH